MYIIKKNKNNKWIIIKEGGKRAVRIFETKIEAMMYAQDKYPNDFKVELSSSNKKNKVFNLKFCLIFIVILFVLVGAFFVVWKFTPVGEQIDNLISEVFDLKTEKPNENPSGDDPNNGTSGTDNPSSGETNPDGTDNGLGGTDNPSSGETNPGGTDNGTSGTDNPSSGETNPDGTNNGSGGTEKPDNSNENQLEHLSSVQESVIYDDFQIHFMMLGNDKAGDSIYIKVGDIDILIDAGSRQASVDTTKEYINRYCKDNTLEYVIATHGDQDHIEGFTDTKNRKGIFSSYICKNIIDFEYTTKTTSTYNDYVTLRDAEVAAGANHYYASDCFNNTNGALRKYELTENVTMEFIYNKFYFEKASDENDHSVCVLFTYTKDSISHYFLFTGDLEEAGEKSIASYYNGSTPEKTLPEVDLFKAGHHGSKTSSNDCLLDIIKPKMCVVTCCCGTDEYTKITDNQFPTQAFINRIAKWTDAVYVTTIYESYEILTNTKGDYISTEGFKAMNGNIIVSCGIKDNTYGVGLYCSNNYIKLKDSEWFNLKVVLDGVERRIRVWPN